jgi:hypothetical protein
MHVSDPFFASAPAMPVGLTMVRAGVGKGLLAWRRIERQRKRSR